MKLRGIHVVAMFAAGLCFCPTARADNTLTVKILSTASIEVSGKACKGATIIVENESGAPVDVTVTIDGTTIIPNTTIPAGGSESATISKKGQLVLCTSAPFRDCFDIQEITDECIFVPTLSEWAVVTMTLLLLVGGTVVFRKVRVAA